MSSYEKGYQKSHEVDKAGADESSHGYGAAKPDRCGSLAVNLNTNTEGRIQNLLADIPHATLMRDVEDFAHEFGLSDSIPLLQKGALVGQNPSAFETLQGLDDNEKLMLRKEITNKWHQPRALYFTIIVCSVGAAVQGWDQTGSNGANLSFPEALGISDAASDPNHALNSWIVGVINAAPNMASAIIGCCYSSAVFFWALEWAPRHQPCQFISANIAVYQVGPIAWRLQLGSAFIPAVPLVLGIYFCPESPRWYMKKGMYAKAFSSLLRLRNTPLQAARDLYYIHSQLKEEAVVFGQRGNYAQRFTELFTIPRIRRATLASFTVMIAQQLCGINIIAFYSSTVFVQAGADTRGALFASWGFGLVAFVFASPALFTIDTFGRRSLLLFTFPNMFWTLLAAGLCNIIPAKETGHLVTVALFVYLFTIFYSCGEGPVPYVYASEVFPLSHREIGMGWATATTFFWGSFLSLTFPSVLAAFGVTGTFCFYAGLNLIAFCLIFLFVPETKQRTLEELDFIFAVPTSTFIRYNFSKAVPYFLGRYVFLRKSARLAPLYHLDDSIAVNIVEDVSSKHGVEVDHVDYSVERGN